MARRHALAVLFGTIAASTASTASAQSAKDQVAAWIEGQQAEFARTALRI